MKKDQLLPPCSELRNILVHGMSKDPLPLHHFKHIWIVMTDHCIGDPHLLHPVTSDEGSAQFDGGESGKGARAASANIQIIR